MGATYLQVAGNSGTVTYTETAGAPSLAVSSAGQVVAAAGLAAGTYSAKGSVRDASGGTGTWAFQLTVVAPAPGTFTAAAVKVYQSEYDFNQQSGQGSALESVAQYQHDVSALSPLGRAMFYRAVQRAPEWLQIPSIMQSVSSAAASMSRGKAATSNGAESTPPAPFELGSSKGDGHCDGGPSDAIVFGLAIVVDVAAAVFNGAISDQIYSADLPEGAKEAAGSVDFVVTFAANIVWGAAQIAKDSVAYSQLSYLDCAKKDMFGYSANIDNTTVQSYNLLTAASAAIDKVQQTASTTAQDVLDLQSQVSAMQATLASSLAQDVKALQSAIGSDTQGIISQLQTDSSAIQQQNSQSRADQWTIAIENALGSSSAVAPASLQVPGEKGGMLTLPNPAGVSVQSVVLADMQALQSAGVTIPSNATDDCDAAAGDVATSQWQAAYVAFRSCYQAFATLP